MRWAAPEIVKMGTFSEKSDAWAFGVVLYEIWTDGEVSLSQPAEIQKEQHLKPAAMLRHTKEMCGLKRFPDAETALACILVIFTPRWYKGVSRQSVHHRQMSHSWLATEPLRRMGQRTNGTRCGSWLPAAVSHTMSGTAAHPDAAMLATRPWKTPIIC